MHQNRIKPRQNMVKSIGSCYDSGTVSFFSKEAFDFIGYSINGKSRLNKNVVFLSLKVKWHRMLILVRRVMVYLRLLSNISQFCC